MKTIKPISAYPRIGEKIPVSPYDFNQLSDDDTTKAIKDLAIYGTAIFLIQNDNLSTKIIDPEQIFKNAKQYLKENKNDSNY